MDPIDKLAWTCIQDRKVLFARSKNKDLFYNPGGKREVNETDAEALMREIKEELNVDLISSTIKYLTTFKAQAHGKPEGVLVEIKCYTAGYNGTIVPSSEIEEVAWFTSADMNRTSPTGQLTLHWLREQNLVD